MRVSAETLNRGWVGMGRWVWVVGGLVGVTGCVGWYVGWLAPPQPTPSTTNVILLSEARHGEQTLHVGRVGTGRLVLIGG